MTGGESQTPGVQIPSSPPPIPWWRRKRVWVGFLLILLTLAGSLAWWLYWSRFVWTDDARIDGDMVLVSSKIQGRIVRLLVEEGDRVQPGQEVAGLDDVEIRESVTRMKYTLEVQRKQVDLAAAEMEKAKARLDDLLAGARQEELSEAQARLRETEARLTQARGDWERIETLFNEGMAAATLRDNAYLAYRVAEEGVQRAREQLRLLQSGERPLTLQGARAEVGRARAAWEVARSRVKEMEAEWRRQEQLLRETVIRAEREGVIARKIARVGEVVQPGQPIYNLMESSEVWVAANIEETDIGKIRVEQPADLSVDAYPGVTFRGKVFHIGPAAASVFSLFPSQNAPGTFVKVTQRIPVKISIQSPDPARRYPLRDGMSVEVKIRVAG
jgi:multidrug resistance efflux pump